MSGDQLALSLNLGIFRTAKWEYNSTKIDKSLKFTLTSRNHAIRGISNDSTVKSSNHTLYNYTNVLTIIQSKHFPVFGWWRLWTVWTPWSFQTSPYGIIDFISLSRSLLINRRLLTFFYMDIFENWQAKTDPRALLPTSAFIEWVILWQGWLLYSLTYPESGDLHLFSTGYTKEFLAVFVGTRISRFLFALTCPYIWVSRI